MQPLENRIWHGDFEMVYEQHKSYARLLSELNEICQPLVVFDQTEETWFRQNQHVIIEVNYAVNGKPYTFYSWRKNDFFDQGFFFLLNRQLPIKDYTFECAPATSSVYFITAIEKQALERNNIEFIPHESYHYIAPILTNIKKSIHHVPHEFTYDLIEELNYGIEIYAADQRVSKPNLKQQQAVIKDEIFPILNWDKIAEKNIKTGKIQAFLNKSI